MGSTNEAKDLVVEIFRETGFKVEADDPIVMAALYQASLIRGAGQETSQNIAEQTAKLEGASRQIMAHLQELVRTSGAAASAKMKEAREREEAELRKTAMQAVSQAIDKATSSGITRFDAAMKTLEVAALNAETRVAKAAESARPGWTALILGVLLASSLMGGAAGVIVSRML